MSALVSGSVSAILNSVFQLFGFTIGLCFLSFAAEPTGEGVKPAFLDASLLPQ